MIISRTEMAKEALEKSLEVREHYGYDFRSPLCIYELCERARVSVRFTDDIASMEGVYAAMPKPKIVLTSLRPLPRRAFTCAHELGHHVFGHGSTIDELKDDSADGTDIPNEFLANAFAGYVLMPAQAVKRAFASRSLDIASATPEQMYVVACSFGVGYETLIGHLAYALKYLPRARAEVFAKVGLPDIRRNLLGIASRSPLVVADRQHAIGTLDAEVDSLVLLPPETMVDTDHVELVKDTPNGRVFRAVRPGLVRAVAKGFGVVVRVSRYQYSGLAKYRHLEEVADA